MKASYFRSRACDISVSCYKAAAVRARRAKFKQISVLFRGSLRYLIRARGR